ELLKVGATDYVLKDRLSKLTVAVKRALREAQMNLEHERMVVALQESEEQYRLVADTASDAIVTIDDRTIIQFANPAATKTFGYSVQEMLGKSLTMLMPERLRDAHRRSHRMYLESGERTINWKSVELVGLHQDGHEFPIEVAIAEGIRGGKKI